jgi:curved DNA-binding protein CbpA
MSHYDTLGVARDASLQDVKRAYRKASSAAHPDKGGSDDLMAKVNAAYDVLSDPERRKRYDATGEDKKIETLDCAARDLLLQGLARAIELDGDPIAQTRRAIASSVERTERDRAAAHAKIARLEARRKTVAAREGPNLVHGLIDQQIAQLRAQLPQMDHFVKTLTRAREMLDLHEYQSPDDSVTGADAWHTTLNFSDATARV